MDMEHQVITITTTYEQNKAISAAFSECGMPSRFANVPAGFQFSLNDISTIIVAILGAGGINAIISSIIQHHKKTIKVTAKEGIITDLEIDSCLSKEELTELIGEIKSSFEQATNQEHQKTN